MPLDPGSIPGFQAHNAAADSLGNSYVLSYASDIRVTKLDPQGNIVYTKQFGGTSASVGRAIAADAAGNVWVTGFTSAHDFPTTVPPLTPAALSPQNASEYPIFLVKLGPTGNTVFSVIGPYNLTPQAVAVDLNGAAYITGIGGSFTTPGAFQENSAIGSAFVIKVGAAGNLMWATDLGGSIPNCIAQGNCPAPPIPGFFSFIPITTQGGNAIAVDAAGSVYVGGVTNAVDFPTTPGAYQITCNCDSTGTNGFVSRLSADGSHLLYSTYLGGTSGASVQAIALDATGEAWVAGPSPAPFPTTRGSAFPNAPANASATPGFLAKVNATGTGLQFSTYLGGSSVARVEGLALNPDNTIAVAALTSGTAGVVVGFDATASKVLFSAPLASEQGDWGFAGNAGGGFMVSGSSGIVTGFKPFAAPVPAIYALTDSASVTTRDHFAPGELVTFYGANLGPAAGQAFTPVNGFVPTTLAGTRVLFDDVPAPLLYVSAGQVNAVVPYEVFEHDRVTVQVTAAAGNASYTFPVVSSDPVIVLSGPKTTLAFNQDGTVNSESNPATQGSIMTILASGGGMMVGHGGITGEITSELSQLELPVSVVFQLTSNTFANAQIDYAGPVPTLVSGMLQINFTVPVGVETGPGFVLKIGDSESVPAFIFAR